MKSILPGEPKEKRIVWIMLIFFGLAMLTIGKGIYNQSNDINQDRLLVPLVLLFFSGLFLTFSFAAFNLYKFVADSSLLIFPILLMVIKNVTSLSEEKCNQLTFRIIGIILLITALVFISFALLSLNINFS